MRVDPFAIGELVEQGAVEAAWGPVIDVLDAGLLAQSGIAQSGGEPLVAAMGLAIEQEPEPVGMAEAAVSSEASSSAKAWAMPERPGREAGRALDG